MHIGDAGSPGYRIRRETHVQYTIFLNIHVSTTEFQYAYLVFWPIEINSCIVQDVFTAQEGYDNLDTLEFQKLIDSYNVALDEDIDNYSWLQKNDSRALSS